MCTDSQIIKRDVLIVNQPNSGFYCFSLSEDRDDSSISDHEELQITLDETKGGAYLSLEEMGVFLSSLASKGIFNLLS